MIETLTRESRPTMRHAWVELTHQCNLECVHCYTESSPTVKSKNPLTVREYERIIQEIYAEGCRSIQFIGGEPTLYRQLPRLIEFSSEIGFDNIEVFTNLLHLSRNLISVSKKHGVDLACSFYSDRPEIHDLITNRVGSHARTARNIQLVLREGLALRVGIIAIPGVNDHRLTETEEFLRALGVNQIGIDRQRGFGRGQINLSSSNENMVELCGSCADGSICIDPEGNVSPCIMSRAWKLGSAREMPIGDALRGKEWTDFASMLTTVRHNEGDYPSAPCSPQIGGPEGCFPKMFCVPIVLPCKPTR